ncbi:ABC transporter permease [Salipaludibacillus daqingensis]|uniref:ABC transporter permease n=1 Tax=Salipaludibacillus daqingensis TaxID=3041001 RepID=UPI002475F909|nr:ABC transporter permease [Salipaludibacillus daqingensis]
MRHFLWKDMIIIVRDRSEMLVLLLMPFILIGILGFALGGILGGDTSTIDIEVALVNEDDREAGVTAFVDLVENFELPVEAKEELISVAKTLNPGLLLEEMLSDQELSEMIHTEEMTEDEAQTSLQSGDIDAILTLPEGFTYKSLEKMVFSEGSGSQLSVMLSDQGSLYAKIFSDMIDGFARNLNLETAIIAAAGEDTAQLGESELTGSNIGGIITVSKNAPANSMQYYTIGMAVMFVLYVAGTIASKAFVEKQQQVFNRIILSGMHPSAYLTGKVISATALAFLQLVILFLLSALIFRTFSLGSADFWIGMMIITLVLAFCVGGLASLLTSLSIRYETEGVSSIFTGGIVTLFAFAGGSFFPLTGMPNLIIQLGNWTPNGAAMTAYLRLVQGYEWTDLMSPLFRSVIITFVLLVISIIIFPKRRSVTS